MPKVPKQLEDNLDSQIKACNENLPKLKTAEEVKKYLMEFVRSVNKLYKAKAGLGTVKLKINEDKILNKNYKEAAAYCKRLSDGLGRGVFKTRRGTVYWIDVSEDIKIIQNHVISVPNWNRLIDEAIDEITRVLNLNNNIAPIIEWLTKAVQATPKITLPETPFVAWGGRKGSAGIFSFLRRAGWLRAVLGVRYQCPELDDICDAFENFSAYLCGICGKNDNLEDLERFACSSKVESDTNLSRLLRAAKGLARLDRNYTQQVIIFMQTKLVNLVKNLNKEYQSLQKVIKESEDRKNNKVLVDIKDVKTNLTKNGVEQLIGYVTKDALFKPKRKAALNRLTNTLKKLPVDLLPAR